MRRKGKESPLLVAIAGPNGAGKTTFYRSHIQQYGMRFVNADLISRQFGADSAKSGRLARAICDQLVHHHESFVFETVFSDPVGDKLGLLKQAAAEGFIVVLCFIGISSHDISEQRVAMRISQGGHDVPKEKLISRFPRTLENLRKAIKSIPNIWIFDNDDLKRPFRLVAVFEDRHIINLKMPIPDWLAPMVLEHL
jgi:predicted ABC-type ATPase